MVSKVVAEAFTAQLATGSPPSWNGITVIGIDTIPEPPGNVDAFIVVQFPVSTADRPGLGRRYFEDGAARIVLNIKEGLGLAQGLEWADGLAALFRSDKIGDGIETFTPTSPIVDDSNENGNWYTFAIIVPYRYQFDG